MNHLKTLQQGFQDYIENGSDSFKQFISSSDQAIAEHRLAAYYNAYRLRLIEALVSDFPVLQKHLGEENFEYLVLDYLKIYPSHHPSIRWAGQSMTKFLADSDRADKKSLSELASFEWAQGLCFDALQGETIFTLAEMTEVPVEKWADLQLNFQPHVLTLNFNYNVPVFWSAMDPENPQNEHNISLQHSEQATCWLLWRKQLRPNWRSLQADEAWALQHALSGGNFGDLCNGLLQWIQPEQAAFSASGYLKQWIADELIESIQY